MQRSVREKILCNCIINTIYFLNNAQNELRLIKMIKNITTKCLKIRSAHLSLTYRGRTNVRISIQMRIMEAFPLLSSLSILSRGLLTKQIRCLILKDER